MVSILAGLNSHKVGIIGVLTFLVGIAADQNVLNLVHLLPAATAQVVQTDLSKVAEVAGIILSYLGKPKTV